MPIVLCEGVFDAIAIKRNAIPLLGKTVQDSLLSKLVSNKASEVIIALDSDASEMVSKVSQKLKKWNLKVSRVELSDSDPSDVGFEGMQYSISKRIGVTDFDLILQRINV